MTGSGDAVTDGAAVGPGSALASAAEKDPAAGACEPADGVGWGAGVWLDASPDGIGFSPAEEVGLEFEQAKVVHTRQKITAKAPILELFIIIDVPFK
ncbi:hypothetical protein [Paenibacillus sp. OAS669]|uniref:hypothetical protein n=1 Tax=Paenibacillus sp. OAS669 TaxID=2663821 RepID=UPI001A082BE2|nr:hypothetical protein [Paenibacillus sp. OAS669]MBE1441140.1 hypothetical protein [Paenibacillus sp. OAS669]